VPECLKVKAIFLKRQEQEEQKRVQEEREKELAYVQQQNQEAQQTIQNAIQTNPNPEVRLAGVQAISFVAKPEDAATVSAILTPSLTNDPEPLIQQAVTETLTKIGAEVPKVA